MAGVHSLQHIEGFFRTDLTQDDPVRTHPQSVLDQLPLLDFAIAFEVGWARLHTGNMRVAEAAIRRRPRS